MRLPQNIIIIFYVTTSLFCVGMHPFGMSHIILIITYLLVVFYVPKTICNGMLNILEHGVWLSH